MLLLSHVTQLCHLHPNSVITDFSFKTSLLQLLNFISLYQVHSSFLLKFLGFSASFIDKVNHPCQLPVWQTETSAFHSLICYCKHAAPDRALADLLPGPSSSPALLWN